MSGVPVPGLRPADQLRGATPEETASLHRQVAQARDYLERQRWCAGVHQILSGLQVPDVVAVMLCKVLPAAPDADEWLWVIVGDVPPAYIVLDEAPDADAALEAYVGEMRAWTQAVRLGQPTGDLIPVNAEPTQKNAELLERRLDLLDAYLEQDDEAR